MEEDDAMDDGGTVMLQFDVLLCHGIDHTSHHYSSVIFYGHSFMPLTSLRSFRDARRFVFSRPLTAVNRTEHLPLKKM